MSVEPCLNFIESLDNEIFDLPLPVSPITVVPANTAAVFPPCVTVKPLEFTTALLLVS